MKKQIELGDQVKDKITGLKGVVVTIATHLYGCRHLWVQPESFCIDDDRAELVKSGRIVPTEAAVADRPGGPAVLKQEPPRRR